MTNEIATRLRQEAYSSLRALRASVDEIAGGRPWWYELDERIIRIVNLLEQADAAEETE